MRHERFGRRGDQALEHLLGPAHETFRRLLFLHFLELLRVVARLRNRFRVLYLVVGSLRNDKAFRVEARPPCTTGNLVEFACLQAAHAHAVELRERREHDRVDGHVDAHAQRVRAADDRKKALLCQFFYQQAIARQHARMVNADTAAQKTLEYPAEPGRKPRTSDSFLYCLALLFRGHAVACKRLRGRKRRILGEMHDVERRLALAQRQLDCSLQRLAHVFVRQRYRARSVGHDVYRTPCPFFERHGYLRDVAKRGAHEQKLRLRERKQGNLPSPAAVGLAVVVEFVHGDASDIRRLPLA